MTKYTHNKNLVEEMLLTNDFYTSDRPIGKGDAISGHVHSLKSTVGIKKSTSSASLSKGIHLGEKTSYMKNSPSIKALENILNEKSKGLLSSQTKIEDSILEEDETESMQDVYHAPYPSYSQTQQHPYRASDLSIQTFETARSQKSSGSDQRRSISTIDEMELSHPGSPALAQSVTMLSHNPSLLDASSSPRLQEIEYNAREMGFKNFEKVSDPISKIRAKPRNQLFNNSQIGNQSESDDMDKSPSSKGASSMLNVADSKPMIDMKTNNDGTRQEAKNISSTALRSRPDSVLNQERNTVGSKHSQGVHDSSKMTKSAEAIPKSKKRFSMRALFKVKSKNHSLSELKENEFEVSRPVKIKAKSFSASNISMFSGITDSKRGNERESKSSSKEGKNKEVNASESSMLKGDARHRRSSIAISSQVPHHDTMQSEQRLPSSSSFLNVFKKSKPFSDNKKDTVSPVKQIEDTQGKDVGHEEPKGKVADVGDIRLNQDLPDLPKTPKVESGLQVEKELPSPFLIEGTMNDVQAEPNLSPAEERLESPLVPHIATISSPQRHDADTFDLGSDTLSFGSPFKPMLNVDSERDGLEADQRGVRNTTNLRKSDSLDQNKMKDQLLGEALFPKSLNPQEVESIVSLERSRSMKSIKSNKRNSFVNYDGSNGNIQYEGSRSQTQSPKVNVQRSGSILKDSSSRRSLNVKEYDLPAPSIYDPIDGFSDLEEFTNFIDFDNLDFSSSPYEEKSTSPRVDGANDFLDNDPQLPLYEYAPSGTYPESPLFVESRTPTPTPTGEFDNDKTPDKGANYQQEFTGSGNPDSPIVIGDDSTIQDSSAPPIQIESYKSISEAQSDIANDISSVTIRGDSSTPISSNSPVIDNQDTGDLHPETQEMSALSANYHDDEMTPIQASVNTSPPTEETPPSVVSSLDYNHNESKSEAVFQSESQDYPSYKAKAMSSPAIESSQILQSAYKLSVASNSPGLSEDGMSFNNRPISMSFKGLKGPSFGSKLTQHDLRSSESHQSFNVSFGDDESDLFESEVGGGFGSEEEEEDDDDDDEEEEDNDGDFVLDPSNSEAENSPPDDKEFNSVDESNILPKVDVNSKSTSLASMGRPSMPLSYNRLSSVSSEASSPMSLSSFISRRTKRSPNLYKVPAMAKSQDKGVRFSSRIILYDTYDDEEYDRHPDAATCNQLTPVLAQFIREELNAVKSDMEVHESSRCFTHFF